MDTKKYIQDFVKLALHEDVGDGDHTSLSCIPETQMGKAQLLVKQDGILAGLEIAKMVYQEFDPSMKIKTFKEDGAPIKVGDIIFEIEGKETAILQTERLVLNFLQRMSGIATQTNEYVQLLDGLATKILDTRKTTPGMRLFEKMAVKLGGGENHRMGLYDMIMIKDNHIDFAGGISQAISRTKEYLKAKNKNLRIEVEARSFSEIKEIMGVGGIDRIMIDNFSVEDTKKAIELIGGKYETESSGGITKNTLRAYAECGVDYISVGALTHQIKSLDLSLKAI
ncbi:MAG: carboxylating nicotinate-nucleotide diphosphorylase [Salinivirgaceae bacterium]|jgi:nicotinate-nucleotide pyrophosphorylase (carboxylating)|nr:carboxylating nicotinate-nucleotide diphosphorylase [Salinivirgaceae bacterium]